MADTKALFTHRFDAARTAWTHGDELAAAQCLRSAIVAARSDRRLRRELASALFSLGKLSRKIGQPGEAEAGPLLSEALIIGEELFGSEDAALAPVLHELSRVHLQQSQHARAEDVLGRLLAIARAKGEEHPDVAAALVDLAFVKRKLRDDASAEALYRDALRIQEKVLGPDHTVTVGTLERLSETCAARGNFAEALTLLYRALPAREAALGAGHERVRAARSRISQLESKMVIAEDTVVAADDARSTVPLADSPEPARKTRTMRYAPVGVAAVAIAIAGLLIVRPRVGSGRTPASTEMSAALPTTAAGALVETVPATRTVSIGTGAAVIVATHTDSPRAASVKAEPTPTVIKFRAPRVHLDSAHMPSIPALPGADAILRAAMERQRTSDTNRTETRAEVSRPTSADAGATHTAPKIMGRSPELAFPQALLRSGPREGQVVVRFMVNELGRVEVATIIVEQSDHELFTAAVRDVLPRFRFEPARTLGPESKPVAAWVSLPFRFTTKKR
jgi:TonB family protein